MSKHTLIIKSRETGQVLKRFEYPSAKIHSKYFWEKMKIEELTKVLKARDIMAADVITIEQIDR